MHGTVLDAATQMTTRGKNRLFATRVAEILQLDELPSKRSWDDIKRAMTARAVREIHEAVALVWPSEGDLRRVLREESGQNSALYVGSYQPEAILRGLARHSLYSDTILLVDPLLHPNAARGKFNPVLNPDAHRSNTLVALRLFALLGPWIDAGIVRVIRTPGDFDDDLFATTLESAKQRHATTPELKAIGEEEADAAMEQMQEYKDYFFLIQPDLKIQEIARKNNPGITDVEIEGIMAELRRRRERHPFYVNALGPDHPDSFISFSSGTNYEMAKLVAAETGSHLVTDMKYRWKEIEIDREAGAEAGPWSSFAKAFAAMKLRYIDCADLDLAVRLRNERRLTDLRLFFRKVWHSVSGDDSFRDSLAEDLAAELLEKINDAEGEWNKIDADLVQWFGAETAASTVLAAGHGDIRPAMAGVAVAGAFNVLQSLLKRRGFRRTHPAAFFLGR